MLTTLRFTPPPPCIANEASGASGMLGVFVSRNTHAHAVSFSVPAHVLATLNVVLGGSLHHTLTGEVLPRSFATAAHTRARRYTLSPGATLATAFCRIDALRDRAAAVANAWLPAQQLFVNWVDLKPTEAAESTDENDLGALETAMFRALQSATVKTDSSPSKAVTQLAKALAHMQTQPTPSMAQVASKLHTTSRGLQRLFASQWQVSPKIVHRLLRIQQAATHWHTSQPNDPAQLQSPQVQSPQLAQLALHLGLNDQAHLAREFRELVGAPPSSMQTDWAAQSPHADLCWALREGARLLTPVFLSHFSKTNAQVPQ